MSSIDARTSGQKYSLLLLPLEETADVELADGNRLFDAETSHLFEAAAVKSMTEMFGTWRWKCELEGRHLFLLRVWAATRPETFLDPEEEPPQHRLDRAWRAFALSAFQQQPSGRAWILTGPVATAEPLRLGCPRSWQEYPTWQRPWYCQKQGYWELRPPPTPRPWMEQWRQFDEALATAFDERLPYLPLVWMPVMSFLVARAQPEIEFRLASFVRATETVLAIPPRQGKRRFAERALKVAPELEGDRYLAGWGSVERRLEELYEQRSACVHGKIPFEELHDKGDEGMTEAARYEYLAEFTARAAIALALKPENRAHFAGRDAIEAAALPACAPPGACTKPSSVV